MALCVAEWYWKGDGISFICTRCCGRTGDSYWRIGVQGTDSLGWRMVCRDCVPGAVWSDTQLTHYIRVKFDNFRGYLYNLETLVGYRANWNHKVQILDNDPVLVKI